MSDIVVGIDLGGSNIKMLIMDRDGNQLYKKKYATIIGEPLDVLNQINSIIERALFELKVDEKVLKGIGIGLPGQVDEKKGIAIYLPNLPGWHNINVADHISDMFNAPVLIENDVRMAAIAEKYLGTGKDVDDMLCVAIGTGIGSGIFLNGALYKGWQNCAGEIGHMTVDANGPLCSCGNYGCLEMYAGGKGIIRRTKEALKNHDGISQINILINNNIEMLSVAVVAQAASKGDELAEKILNDTAVYLGIAIANLVNILNPQVVVIGGGVMKCGDVLLDPIKKEIKKRTMPVNRNVLIEPAKFGEWAGAVGAAEIACQKYIRLEKR